MSNWVYVSGSVLLDTGIYKYILDKYYTVVRDEEGRGISLLPYPEEQISFSVTNENFSYKIAKNISSYPIIKRVVEQYISDIDAGEHDTIYYSLHSNNRVQEVSLNTQSDDTMCDVNMLCESVLCINDSVRWTDCETIYSQLINFFYNLVHDDIGISNGIITLSDLCAEQYTMRITKQGIVTEIYNTETAQTRYEYYKLYWNDADLRPLQILKKVNSKEEFDSEE